MAVCAMEHRRLAYWVLRFLAQQCGQNVVTILTGVGRQMSAKQIRTSRHEIDFANGLSADSAGRDAARPAREEGHTVPAFPNVTLDASQSVHTSMAIGLDTSVS